MTIYACLEIYFYARRGKKLDGCVGVFMYFFNIKRSIRWLSELRYM